MKKFDRAFHRPLSILALALATSLGSASAQEPVIVESNLVYGTAADYAGFNVSLALDAYYVASAQTNRPVIILTHGGGFGAGDKGYTPAQGNFYPDMAAAFATNGFVAFSINYRLWPGCPGGCPGEIDMAVEDVMTALGWIRAHRAQYGVDADRVLIAGDSAGGGLAINAAYRGTNSSSFLGCISLWGGIPPYGTDVHAVNTSPVTAQTPSTCLIHGTADTVVPCAVSEMLSSNLTAAGVYNELHPLAGCDHYPVMADGIYQTNLVADVIQSMLAFARRMTGDSNSAAPIRLGSPSLTGADGWFHFNLTGPTNLTVAIERSTNLMNTWQAVSTNQIFTGTAWFTDAVSAASQFYRARIVPPK